MKIGFKQKVAALMNAVVEVVEVVAIQKEIAASRKEKEQEVHK